MVGRCPASRAITPRATSRCPAESGIRIGYARCSTEEQDLTAQVEALAAVGVGPERICVDRGLSGTNRERPGLGRALAACRSGGTLVVTAREEQ